MEILFFTHNFPPEKNAAASRVFERACYWVRWGHKVTVITCAPNFPEGRLYPGYKNSWYQTEDMSGVRVVRVKTFVTPNEGVVLRTLNFLSYMVAAFCAGLFQKRADAVVSTSPQFFAAVGAWALAAVRGLPFIFELGDLWPATIVAVGAMKPNVLLRGLEKLELFLYRRAAAVIALTEAFREDLVRRGIPADKIFVIRNGVDLPRYSPRPRDRELEREWRLAGSFVVGYIGTFGMAHALENVLVAAERLRDSKVKFLLVGGGAAREKLVSEVRRRALENVVIVPPQPKERTPAFWSLCDVALVHLKKDPLFAAVIPSKMFEGMAMGLPILLASVEGEASRIVHAERVGVVVPAEDPEALARAVKLLQENDVLRQTLARASLAAASGHSREHQAREMIEVLSRIAACPAKDYNVVQA